jgi:hypothetical protein
MQHGIQRLGTSSDLKMILIGEKKILGTCYRSACGTGYPIAGGVNIQATIIGKPSILSFPFSTSNVNVMRHFAGAKTVFEVTTADASTRGVTNQINLSGSCLGKHLINEQIQ